MNLRKIVMLGRNKLIFAVILLAAIAGLGLATVSEAQPRSIILPWDSPPPYRIAYLVAQDALANDSVVAPSQLEATLGSLTVHNWNELLTVDALAPIDALVIHKSALTEVDKNWLMNAYQRGIVVATFNVDVRELAALVDDPCITTDAFASEPYTGSFFIVASHLILGQPEDVALLRAAKVCGKAQVTGVEHWASERFGRSTDAIDTIGDYNRFARVLVSHLEGIKEDKQTFEADKHPTPDAITP